MCMWFKFHSGVINTTVGVLGQKYTQSIALKTFDLFVFLFFFNFFLFLEAAALGKAFGVLCLGTAQMGCDTSQPECNGSSNF